MLKKLVILMAAISVLSACNDSDNKKKSKATAKPAVEAQGQDKTEEENKGDVEQTDQAAADAELKAEILANDWCDTRNALTGGEKVTSVLSNTPRENSLATRSNMTHSDYRETEDSLELIQQLDLELRVEDGKIVFQGTLIDEDGVKATTRLPSQYAKFLSDEVGKIMILSEYKDEKDILNYGKRFYNCDADAVVGDVVQPKAPTAPVEEVVQEKK